MLIVEGISDRVKIGDGYGFSDEPEQNDHNPFELQRQCVGVDQISNYFPIDNFDECVNKQAYFLKKGVS